MTLFSDAITLVADDCKIDSGRTGVSDRIKREINRICNDIWDGFSWSFRWRTYRIVTDVDVTAGTVTATRDSRTVTGSGTAFAASHVGRHIYFPGDGIQNWYQIRAFTSATQIELDVPYQGTTGSAKTYTIRKFDYVLPTEIYDFGTLIATHDNLPLDIVDPRSANIVLPTPLNKGFPQALAIYGSDSMPTNYTTGTLSGTVNTTTVTGASTSWLANVYPGDEITIGDYKYTVRNVDSDTQLTLYNQQMVASAALTTYTIKRQFGRIARIMWPSTDNYTIEIRALRKYAPLVNDNDTNEILHRFVNAIILKISALELKSQDDKRRRELEQEAEIFLARARAEDEVLTFRGNVDPIHSYRFLRRGRRIV